MIKQLDLFESKSKQEQDKFLLDLDNLPLTREPFYRIYPDYFDKLKREKRRYRNDV